MAAPEETEVPAKTSETIEPNDFVEGNAYKVYQEIPGVTSDFTWLQNGRSESATLRKYKTEDQEIEPKEPEESNLDINNKEDE